MFPEIPAVCKLGKSVIRILGCNPGTATLQGTNTYILGTGKERLLVDTGDGKSDAYIRHLRSTMNSENFTISRILITHWHFDHTGGIRRILNLFNSFHFINKT
ncbi:hypothetical protein MXB_63 [Myxobolus squamalis]|nr:hypothetical protein MXB_63 [Myxobolus squamalis]